MENIYAVVEFDWCVPKTKKDICVMGQFCDDQRLSCAWMQTNKYLRLCFVIGVFYVKKCISLFPYCSNAMRTFTIRVIFKVFEPDNFKLVK